MNNQDIVSFLDNLVFERKGYYLNDTQRALLIACLSREKITYRKIAQEHGYSDKYFKQDIGPKLWKLISEVCEEKVKKNTLKSAVSRALLKHKPPSDKKLEFFLEK